MDCRDGDKTWDWQEKNGIGMALNFDISQCIWNEVTQNAEDLSYMFDETTPVKACADMAYKVMGNADDFSDGWLSQCFNDFDMNCSPDDLNNLEDSNIHNDVSESWNDSTECENRSIQPQVV